jgi:hypothetical protein
MDTILPVFASVLGLAGALLGVWLGSRLMRGNEERTWRRNHCLEAYTDVLRACAIVAFETEAAYGMECATSDHAKQRSIVLEKVADMYRAADRASLLGPQEIRQPLYELVLFCGKELGARSTHVLSCQKVSGAKSETKVTFGFIQNLLTRRGTTLVSIRHFILPRNGAGSSILPKAFEHHQRRVNQVSITSASQQR